MKDRTIQEILNANRPSEISQFERLKLEAELARALAYVERIEAALK